MMTLCTYPILPWIDCSNDSVVGFEGNVVRRAVIGLGRREGIDFIMRCMSTKSMVFDALKMCDTVDRCDAAFGDISSDITAGLMYNLTYSTPYQCTSLAAMTTSVADTEPWAIFKPFTWQLWVLLLSIPFVYGFLLSSIDVFIHRKYNDLSHGLCKPSTISEFVFDHASLMLSQGDRHEILRTHRKMYKDRFLTMLRMAIQIVFLTFAFMCFVISSTYTAELTTNLIQRTPRLRYTSIDELLFEGNPIVPEERIEYFRSRWSVDPLTYRYENTASYRNAMTFLLNGSIDGIIGNRVTLQWLQNTDTDCTVSVIPSSDTAYYGLVVAWSKCASREVIQGMNIRINEMEMDGTIEQLAKTSLRALSMTGSMNERKCVSTTTTIGINNVSGVFVIMACGILVPISLFSIKYMIDFARYILHQNRTVIFGIESKSTKSTNTMDSHDESP